MANLVVITHSFYLGEELIKFAKVTSGNKELDYEIINASGLDEHTFGTDAFKIIAALEKTNNDFGTIIFHEIGSSLMSAETALSMLEDSQQEDVIINRLPLLESLFIALNINSYEMRANTLHNIIQEEIIDIYK